MGSGCGRAHSAEQREQVADARPRRWRLCRGQTQQGSLRSRLSAHVPGVWRSSAGPVQAWVAGSSGARGHGLGLGVPPLCLILRPDCDDMGFALKLFAVRAEVLCLFLYLFSQQQQKNV